MTWLKSKLEKFATHRRDQSIRRSFDQLLAIKLDAATPSVQTAFHDLINACPPEDLDHFHIEVFRDTPDFAFYVYAMAIDNRQLKDHAALLEFQDKINRIWPLFSSEERDAFTLWENDPKWGPQEALYQPLDNKNCVAAAKPWFIKILQIACEGRSMPFTFASHDGTPPEHI